MNLTHLIDFSVASLKANRKDVYLKIQSITTELIDMRVENDHYKVKMNIERFKTLKNQSEVNTLESNLSSLNELTDGLKSKISQLEIDVDGLERHNNALEEQNNQLRKNINF